MVKMGEKLFMRLRERDLKRMSGWGGVRALKGGKGRKGRKVGHRQERVGQKKNEGRRKEKKKEAERD